MLTRSSLIVAGLGAASLDAAHARAPFLGGLARGGSGSLPEDLFWTTADGPRPARTMTPVAAR